MAVTNFRRDPRTLHLCNSRLIIYHHGDWIWLDSVLTRGSTFGFVLPLQSVGGGAQQAAGALP